MIRLSKRAGYRVLPPRQQPPERFRNSSKVLDRAVDGERLLRGHRQSFGQPVERAARSSNSCFSARSFMDDDAFVVVLLAEMLRRFLHTDEIDAQERRCVLLEVQRELQPIERSSVGASIARSIPKGAK
jgi:hypothetical protein